MQILNVRLLSCILFFGIMDKISRSSKKMATNLRDALAQGTLKFSDVLAYIEQKYHYQARAFRNGTLHNQQHENQGSAKILSFAQLEGLNEHDTLALFAEHYQHVLTHPEGTEHQNIRQFMQHGWQGVYFESLALSKK